jgi:bacillithiol system protein YtxJ
MHARWKQLESEMQLQECIARSAENPHVIFKHSTRCIISKMALQQFEEQLDSIPANVELLYLDLLSHRDISNSIATQLNVHHESPQVIVIKEGKAVFHESHHSIDAATIAQYC